MIERHMVRVACYMLVFIDDKLLLIKQKKRGYGDKKYTVPSGHLEDGETPLMCAIRETKEEIDIDVKEADFMTVMYRINRTVRDCYFNGDYIDFFFLCKRFIGTPKNNEPDKCYEIIYVDSINDLPENMWEHVETVIQNISGENLRLLNMKT